MLAWKKSGSRWMLAPATVSYGWRIDGQFSSLGFESAALAAAADWKAGEK
jgi:hypothetical protein